MFRKIKNLASYVWFVFSLDYLQLGCTLIDIFILVFAFFKREEVLSQSTLTLFCLAILTNFVWQIVNVANHFAFLKEEEPEKPLVSMLEVGGTKKKDFKRVKMDSNLFNGEMPYQPDKVKDGVLVNHSVDAVLLNSTTGIRPVEVGMKRSNTKTYIKQYESILLKFLNHKWHDVTHKGGEFTNDAKICLGSELVKEEDGSYTWAICKGWYYNGVLTNFIFSQYVGGSYYRLYPPINVDNTCIKPFGSSDFSDHIGVSTLLVTSDNYVVVFEQASNAGYNAGKMMPSGSGSLDYADYIKGEDFRQMVIRGAQRELLQEASLEKKMEEDETWIIETRILSFYRDLERGGKPEFCCISSINKKVDSIINDVVPNAKELARGKRDYVKVDDSTKWKGVLANASLSLRMCYTALIESF